MDNIHVYFSDYFDVSEEVIEEYGAINISLINDLPLFVDPFLLFNSEEDCFQTIHEEMIDYLLYLKELSSQHVVTTPGLLETYFMFPEIKQTWLGFSKTGNSGIGLGKEFALNLHSALNSYFKNFGEEKVTKSSHFEKICLVSDHVGRDKISDFSTHFTKKYLLEYTEEFAKRHLAKEKCKKILVDKVLFNKKTHVWQPKEYYLPNFDDDYVILTPKKLLTRDQTYINRKDMFKRLEHISSSIPDQALRFALNNYLTEVVKKNKKEVSAQEKERLAIELLRNYPELIDYYTKYKEDHGDEAASVSEEAVQLVQMLFNKQLQDFISKLNKGSDFYKTGVPDSYYEAYKRAMFLKHAIEDQDCYRLFYLNGEPIRRENDLQIMYRLVWFATIYDVNREVNNGRGPVDFKVSYGANDKTLVEFKLASNKALKKNLSNQVEVYLKANDIKSAIKVIMFFTEKEELNVKKVLKELKLIDSKNIILIDARNDNKESGSKVG